MLKRIKAHMKSVSVEDRALYKNISGTFVVKGLSIIINFLTTSFYISYFKDDVTLGVWYTILSILQWILTFDMGIGNGLRNKVAGSFDDKKLVKTYISSGYIALTGVAILISTIGAICLFSFDLNELFNVSSNDLSASVLSIVVLTTFLGIMTQFVLKIITSILFALQKNIIANIASLVTNSIVLCFLVVGSYYVNSSQEKIIHIAIVYSIAIIIPLGIQTIFVFCKDLKECSPSIKCFDRSCAKDVVGLGGAFFIVQLGLLFLTSTNSWFISYLYSPNDVVVYQNYYRIFSLPTMLFSLLTQPMWSGISTALYRKDYFWIRAKYKMIRKIAFLASTGCVILALFLPIVFRIWLGAEYYVNGYTSLIFCLLSIEHIFMYAETCIANGLSKIKCQVIFAIMIILFKYPVVLICSRILDAWESVVMAETVCMLYIVIVQPYWNKKNLRTISE